MAPLGTPNAIVTKVSEDLHQVTREPELQPKLAALGSYTRPSNCKCSQRRPDQREAGSFFVDGLDVFDRRKTIRLPFKS